MSLDWGKLRQIAKVVLRAERGIESVSTSAPRIVNVCEKIKCPYAYKTSPDSSSGCCKYLTALECHLLSDHSELKTESTPYFLHSKVDSVNIARLKTENDSFFLDDPENRKSLEFEVRMGHTVLYAPYSEETFDLTAYLNQ